MKRSIELQLLEIFSSIGMDKPENMEDICDFVVNDITETADKNYSNGDIVIALRRFIESVK